MGRVLELLRKAAPGILGWLTAWSVIEALTTIGTPFVARQLLDSVGAARTTGLLAIPLTWLVVEFAMAAVRGVAQRGAISATQILQSRGSLYVTKRVLEKACNVTYTRFEEEEFVNQLGRAREDAVTHATSFGVHVFTILRAALIFVGCLVLLWTVSMWTLPVLIAAALPTFVLDTMLARKAYALERANMHRNRQGWYLEWLLTAEQTAKEIRSLAAGRWLVSLYERVHTPFRDGQVALARRYFRRRLLPTVFGSIALYVPYFFVVTSTVSGKTSMGGMLLFALAFQQGAAALSQLLGAFARAFEQHLYVRNVLGLLDYPEDDPETAPDADDVVGETPEVVLEDVWFTYPGAQTPVLRGLNLRIRAGETLAIVGRNGIGKTTMVKLLVGLYPIDRGRILLGGIDVATRSAAWRRANIGVVFQDFVKFEFDVAANVGVGWAPESTDRTRINRALEMADAQELVDGLPKGLDTAMGTAFGGRGISGGQWQRIAFARLFMRRSRLWILDEPTSAMDPESEERTFHRFHEWTEGRTSIIVAHRFSTVRIADRIAVIDDGQVTELGSHDELVELDGHYARMFKLQAQRYTAPEGAAPEADGFIRVIG